MRAPTISGQLYAAGRRAGGPIKVGYSYRPSTRVKALGADLVLLYQTDRSYRNAREVERCAHGLLESAGKRVHPCSEWFTVTLEEAREAIERAGRLFLWLEAPQEWPNVFARVEAIRRADPPDAFDQIRAIVYHARRRVLGLGPEPLAQTDEQHEEAAAPRLVRLISGLIRGTDCPVSQVQQHHG